MTYSLKIFTYSVSMVAYIKIFIAETFYCIISYCIADVGECISGIHNCSQVCIETVGGYNCSCYSGHQLLADGINCEG